jgi:hypothetical protein
MLGSNTLPLRSSEGRGESAQQPPRASAGPKSSMGRFEFDPSWVIIRCLAGVGLAKITGVPVKTPRSRMRDPSEPVRGQYWKQ